MPHRYLVLVVDDDLGMLRAIKRLLRQHDYEPILFSSAQAFKSHTDFENAACVILDINLNDGSGIELRQGLKAAGVSVLQEWTENCPDNFANRAALVAAEIARLEGREFDAERLYEQAIRSARANGFIHNEALAYELAARFYAAHGFKQFADLYLRNARYGYLRWGAVGKVRQLDETYPDLRQEESLPDPMSTIGAPVSSSPSMWSVIDFWMKRYGPIGGSKNFRSPPRKDFCNNSF